MRTLSNLAAVATLSLVNAAQALAQTTTPPTTPAVPTDVLPGRPTNAVGGDLSFKDLLGFIVNWLISIAGAIALLFLIVGGIEYMTAGGSDEKVQRAKNTMRNALVGLIVVLLSYFIIRNFVTLTFRLGSGAGA